MKASELVKAIQHFQKIYGEDVEVQLQSDPRDTEAIIHDDFFILDEKSKDEAGKEETFIRMRTWPY